MKIGLQCTIRHVSPPFQISGKSNHLFAEESGSFDGFGQADVVITPAVFAPIHQLLIFGNDNRFCDECNLLKVFCFTVNKVELLLAVGTIGELEFDDFVDEFWGGWEFVDVVCVQAVLLFFAWFSCLSFLFLL